MKKLFISVLAFAKHRMRRVGQRNAAALIAASALCFLGICAPARASVVVSLSQLGPDVIANATGTLNLSDLTYFSSGGVDPSIEPKNGFFYIGETPEVFGDAYSGISGPSTFGPGPLINASSGEGGMLGVTFPGLLWVPTGYVTGTPVIATSTFDDTTLAALGVTPGTYIWSWGSGADADSLTLVAEIATPLPATAPLLTSALGILALMGYWRRTRKSIAA
jgi:hypothetical protein